MNNTVETPPHLPPQIDYVTRFSQDRITGISRLLPTLPPSSLDQIDQTIAVAIPALQQENASIQAALSSSAPNTVDSISRKVDIDLTLDRLFILQDEIHATRKARGLDSAEVLRAFALAEEESDEGRRDELLAMADALAQLRVRNRQLEAELAQRTSPNQAGSESGQGGGAPGSGVLPPANNRPPEVKGPGFAQRSIDEARKNLKNLMERNSSYADIDVVTTYTKDNQPLLEVNFSRLAQILKDEVYHREPGVTQREMLKAAKEAVLVAGVALMMLRSENNPVIIGDNSLMLIFKAGENPGPEVMEKAGSLVAILKQENKVDTFRKWVNNNRSGLEKTKFFVRAKSYNELNLYNGQPLVLVDNKSNRGQAPQPQENRPATEAQPAPEAKWYLDTLRLLYANNQGRLNKSKEGQVLTPESFATEFNIALISFPETVKRWQDALSDPKYLSSASAESFNFTVEKNLNGAVDQLIILDYLVTHPDFFNSSPVMATVRSKNITMNTLVSLYNRIKSS